MTVILVTSLCWWLYDGDWFQMLVTESLCWRLFSLCSWFLQCIKSVTNILNLSLTHFVFNIRPQHRVSFNLRYLDPNRVNLVRCNKDDYHHVSCLQKRNCLRNQNQAIVRPASNNLYHINNSIRAAKTNLERFNFRWLKFRAEIQGWNSRWSYFLTI